MAGTDDKKRLVISIDDLEPDVPKQYPGLSGHGQSANTSTVGPSSAKTGSGSMFGGSQVKQNLIAGFLGGLLAWFCGDLFHGFDDSVRRTFVFSFYIDTAVWTGIIGASVGGFLGASEGVTSGSRDKAVSGGFLGAAVGFGGGFVGGLFAQYIYSSILLGGPRGDMTRQVMARTIGWSLLGLAIGLANGLAGRSSKKVVNGLIGGLIGGAIGGLAFDFIARASSGGTISRLFGIVAMGTFTGAAIGMVEEARKEAWLRVVGGPLVGKQFILYNTVTRIGQSPSCEITLVKDPMVHSEHARFIVSGNRYRLEAFPGAIVSVNGMQTNNSALRGGDSIQIGSWVMVFEEKAASPAGY